MVRRTDPAADSDSVASGFVDAETGGGLAAALLAADGGEVHPSEGGAAIGETPAQVPEENKTWDGRRAYWEAGEDAEWFLVLGPWYTRVLPIYSQERDKTVMVAHTAERRMAVRLPVDDKTKADVEAGWLAPLEV